MRFRLKVDYSGLTVNSELDMERLLDPELIRGTVLPKAREIFRVKVATLAKRKAEAEAMLVEPQREVDEWTEKIEALETLAGVVRDDAPEYDEDGYDGEAAAGSTVDLVVAAVERVGRPVRSRDIREMLAGEGQPVTSSGVTNALYYAANTAGRVQKLPGRGWYAPIDYRDDGSESADSDGPANPFSPLQDRLEPGGGTVSPGDRTG